MNRVFVVCLLYLATMEGNRVMTHPEYDYYDYEYVNYPLPRNAPESVPDYRNGGKMCGDLVCTELSEDIHMEGTVVIPNAHNVTCQSCYNLVTKKDVSNPVTQQREVMVFEKTNDTCYRLKRIERINDGCKCSRELRYRSWALDVRH